MESARAERTQAASEPAPQTKPPTVATRQPAPTIAATPIFYDADLPSIRLGANHIIQAKLVVSQPGDASEEEADRLAEQVMRMPSAEFANYTGPRVLQPATALQRKCGRCEEEEEKKELTIQRRQAGAAGSQATAAASVERDVQKLEGRGQPLPSTLRQFFEPRFAYDFGSVRLHTDEGAARSAQAINAMAYTIGPHVVFASGRYAPQTTEGRKLLAHELTHVIQQGAGRRLVQNAPPVNQPAEKREAAFQLQPAIANGPLAQLLSISPAARSERLLQRDDPPPGQTPATTPTAAVPDEETFNSAIDGPLARERNVYWWSRFNLGEVRPHREYDPINQPVGWANRTLALQRLFRRNGAPLDRDGIFGPRTFMALRIISYAPEGEALRPEVAGLGFNIEAMAAVEAQSATRAAAADILKPQFAAQWTASASSAAVMRFYRNNYYMVRRDQEVIDQFIFAEGTRPDRITREDRLELLTRLLSGMTLAGTAGLFTVERTFLHEFDVGRAVDRDRNAPANPIYFRFMSEEYGYVQSMIQTLGLHLPATERARAVMREIEEQQIAVATNHLAALLAVYYLPPIEEGRRAAIIPQYFTERDAREAAEREAIEANNREAARQRADRFVAFLDGPRDHLLWGGQVQRALSEFIGQPGFFELVLDDLRARPGNYFDRLFTDVEALHQFEPLAMLIHVTLPTRYGEDSRVVAAMRALNEHRQGYMHHRYVAGDDPHVMLRGSQRLSVGQVAGDLAAEEYIYDEDIKRLKPERQDQLVAEMDRQAILHAGRVMSGEDTNTYTQEEFGKLIVGEAVKAIGGIREEDIETVKYEESLRLLGVRTQIVDGVERSEVEYEIVCRTSGAAGSAAPRGGDTSVECGGGAQWAPVANTRRWRSDSDFEYRLYMYGFSQNADVIDTAAKVITFAAVAVIALELGIVALLIELGGGAVAVSVSIGISMLIYMLTHKRWTLEGFLVAALQGYLAAVGFKLFAPVGRLVTQRIIGDVMTASFRRIVAGWLIGRATVGALTGVTGGPLSLFVEDLVRIATQGGGFSPFEAYLTQAAYGFVLGVGFEIGGSALLAPLFRAGGRTGLATITEVVERLRSANISSAQWEGNAAGALSRMRVWLYANLSEDIAQKIYGIFSNKFRQVGENFVTGLRVTIHRQVLELAEIELTREAVNGLERMLVKTTGTMSNDAVANMLGQISRTPERAVPYFTLLNGIDEATLTQLIATRQLQPLAESVGVLALSTRRVSGEISGLLTRFRGSVAETEGFAQRLGRVGEEAQDRVMNALRDHGTAVTPGSLLRIAESGTILSEDVVGGLARLIRVSTDVPGFEALLNAAPNDRIGNFLTFARTVPELDLPHLLALATDPARGARLLAYADDAAQLFSLMQRAGHNLGELDTLMTSTLAAPGSTRAPAALQSLLGRPGNTVASLTVLVQRVHGDAALLERTIARMGLQADVERVLTTAQAHASTKTDAASMRRFLQMADAHTWNIADDMVEFITRIHRAQASPVTTTFRSALDALDNFATHHSGSTAAPPTPAGFGPRNLASPTSFVTLTLTDGTTAEVYILADSLQHWHEGHTFENFWFDPGKIDRSGKSTFWPPGTPDSALINDAMQALQTSDFKTALETQMAAGGNFARPNPDVGVNVGGTLFEVGVRLPDRTLHMFYPNTGPRATPVQRHVLHGIKAMLHL
ncbi:MAG TPA: DUF4157 domain-containing protein [Pyrinomonadaceae bacterium]